MKEFKILRDLFLANLILGLPLIAGFGTGPDYLRVISSIIALLCFLYFASRYFLKRDGLRYFIIAAICELVMLRPLFSGLTYPWSNTYANSVLVFVFFVTMIGFIWKGGKLFKTKLDIPILSFFLILVISALRSVNAAQSLNHMYLFMGYTLLYFLIVSNFREENERKVLIFALLLSTAIVSVYGIYQFFWGLDRARKIVDLYQSGAYPPEFIARLHTNKAFSTFVYPPALAGFLVLVIPVTLSVCLSGRTRFKKFAFALPLSAFLCLILTFSKAGWFSFIISMLIFVLTWLILIKRVKTITAILWVSIPTLIFTFVFVYGYIPQVNLEGFIASLGTRFDYWKSVPAMFRENPILGSGPGTFGVMYPKYRYFFAKETQMAHNNYLQILTEAGIAGLLAFLWVLYSFLRESLKILKKEREKILILGAFAGIAGFLIQSFFDFALYIPGIAMNAFLLMGFIMSHEGNQYSRTLKKHQKNILTFLLIVLTAYMLLIIRRPMLGERFLNYGIQEARAGNIDKAISCVEKAIDYSPREASFHFQLGLLYEGKTKPEEKESHETLTGRIWLNKAISSFENAVLLNPNTAVYHSRLARLYWLKSDGKNTGLIQKTGEQLSAAVSCYPVLPKYHMELGRFYHVTGNYAAAKREYMLTIMYQDAAHRQSQKQEMEKILENVQIWIKELGRR